MFLVPECDRLELHNSKINSCSRLALSPCFLAIYGYDKELPDGILITYRQNAADTMYNTYTKREKYFYLITFTSDTSDTSAKYLLSDSQGT